MTHESEATAERRDSATPGNDVHTQIRIVGLGGSLAAPSASLTALKVALEGAASAGADTQQIWRENVNKNGTLLGRRVDLVCCGDQTVSSLISTIAFLMFEKVEKFD